MPSVRLAERSANTFGQHVRPTRSANNKQRLSRGELYAAEDDRVVASRCGDGGE